MGSIIEWTVNTLSGGGSDPVTEMSTDEMTGWIESFWIDPDENVNSGMTGILSEVGGIEDQIWQGTIGNGAGVKKYPTHAEVLPDNSDPGSTRLFYLSQQRLKLVLAGAGGEVANAATIKVKFIPA